MERNKGITLIVLVITIIVLLILTGIVLNLVLEDNGLFNKSKVAVEEYKKKEAKEELELKVLDAQAKILENTKIFPNLKNICDELIQDPSIELKQDATMTQDSYIIVKYKEYLFKIDANFIVELYEGSVTLALYDRGNEYQSITGNWNGYTVNYAPSFVKNVNSLQLIGNGDAACYWETTNKVNLNGYAKLCMIVAGNGDFGMNIGLDSNPHSGDMQAYATLERQNLDGTERKIVLEIPQNMRNGEYYIKFQAFNLGNNENAYLYEAYLENE